MLRALVSGWCLEITGAGIKGFLALFCSCSEDLNWKSDWLGASCSGLVSDCWKAGQGERGLHRPLPVHRPACELPAGPSQTPLAKWPSPWMGTEARTSWDSWWRVTWNIWAKRIFCFTLLCWNRMKNLKELRHSLVPSWPLVHGINGPATHGNSFHLFRRWGCLAILGKSFLNIEADTTKQLSFPHKGLLCSHDMPGTLLTWRGNVKRCSHRPEECKAWQACWWWWNRPGLYGLYYQALYQPFVCGRTSAKE